MRPDITVCIPVYNNEKYLRKCIESVLGQTYQNFELYVIDDCSTDRSVEIARGFDEPRLHLARNERNLGLAGNWNKCLSFASTRFVQILHGDDFLLPEHLKIAHRIIERDHRIGYVHTACWIIDDLAQVTALHRPFRSNTVVAGLEAFKQHICGNYVSCPTVLARRECYRQVGPFDPNLLFALDWDMWLRIELAGYYVAYSARPLMCNRFGHENAATTIAMRKPAWVVNEEFKVIAKAFSSTSLPGITDAKGLQNRAILKRMSGTTYFLVKQVTRLQDPRFPMLQLLYWLAIAKRRGLFFASLRMTVRSLILGTLHEIREMYVKALRKQRKESPASQLSS